MSSGAWLQMIIIIPSLVSLLLPSFSSGLNLAWQLEGHSSKIQVRPYYSSAPDPCVAPHLTQNRIQSPTNGLRRPATPRWHPADFISDDSHTSPLQEQFPSVLYRHQGHSHPRAFVPIVPSARNALTRQSHGLLPYLLQVLSQMLISH